MGFSAEEAVAVLAAGLAYATVVSSAEFVRDSSLVARGGLLDWDVLQTRTRFSVALSRRVPSGAASGTRVWMTVCWVRGLAGVASFPVTGSVTAPGAIALVIVGLTTLAVMYRMMFGLDGSDQLIAVLSIACGTAVLLDGESSLVALCWFTTVLVTIAYVTAGTTKLFSRTWRHGEALALVMRTHVYGNPGLASLARGVLGRAATRAIIIIELAFPLVYVGSPTLTLLVLGSMAAFHVGSAVLMGLNCFLPTYVSTFGCIFWVSERLW